MNSSNDRQETNRDFTTLFAYTISLTFQAHLMNRRTSICGTILHSARSYWHRAIDAVNAQDAQDALPLLMSSSAHVL